MCHDSKDVKCQMVKHLDYGGGSQKKYEGQQNRPKIISMDILRVFSDHHMCHQN